MRLASRFHVDQRNVVNWNVEKATMNERIPNDREVSPTEYESIVCDLIQDREFFFGTEVCEKSEHKPVQISFFRLVYLEINSFFSVYPINKPGLFTG